jgi:hypothetical protein
MVQRLARRNSVQLLIAKKQFAEAERTIGELREHCATPLLPDILEGDLRLAEGDPRRALECYERVTVTEMGDDCFEHGPNDTIVGRARALSGLGCPGEAADLLIDTFTRSGHLPLGLAETLTFLDAAGRPPADLVLAAPVDKVLWVLGSATHLPAATMDALFEAAFTRFEKSPERLGVLVAADLAAPRLALERVIVWTARLRAQGLVAQNPLLRVAEDPDAGAVLRIRAAAVALVSPAQVTDGFRAVEAVRSAVAELHPGEVAGITEELRHIAPELLPELAAGAPPDPDLTIRRLQPTAVVPAVSILLYARDEAVVTLGILQRLAATLPEAPPTELIVIDDNSTDATPQLLTSLGGEVTTITTHHPRGFGASVAVAARLARGSLLVVPAPGPDSPTLPETWFREFHEHFEDPACTLLEIPGAVAVLRDTFETGGAFPGLEEFHDLAEEIRSRP